MKIVFVGRTVETERGVRRDVAVDTGASLPTVVREYADDEDSLGPRVVGDDVLVAERAYTDKTGVSKRAIVIVA